MSSANNSELSSLVTTLACSVQPLYRCWWWRCNDIVIFRRNTVTYRRQICITVAPVFQPISVGLEPMTSFFLYHIPPIINPSHNLFTNIQTKAPPVLYVFHLLTQLVLRLFEFRRFCICDCIVEFLQPAFCYRDSCWRQ